MALAGPGVGSGSIFGALLLSTARNPFMRNQCFTWSILGFALAEALASILCGTVTRAKLIYDMHLYDSLTAVLARKVPIRSEVGCLLLIGAGIVTAGYLAGRGYGALIEYYYPLPAPARPLPINMEDLADLRDYEVEEALEVDVRPRRALTFRERYPLPNLRNSVYLIPDNLPMLDRPAICCDRWFAQCRSNHTYFFGSKCFTALDEHWTLMDFERLRVPPTE